MTARWTTDEQILRLRNGTLPDGYDRHHKRRFGFHGGVMLLAMAAGVLLGTFI